MASTRVSKANNGARKRGTTSARSTPRRAASKSDGNLLTLDALELRRLAEVAAGQLNDDLVLVRDGARLCIKKAAAVRSRDKKLCKIKTDGRVKKKRPFSITIPQGDELDIRDKYDALFWSESAIEKFVRPYYARLMTPEALEALIDRFIKDDTVLAMGHIPPSISEPLPEAPSLIRAQGGAQSQALGLKVLRLTGKTWSGGEPKLAFISVEEYLRTTRRSR